MTSESSDLEATVVVPFDRAVDLTAQAVITRFQDQGFGMTRCPTSPGAEARLHKRVDILQGFITPLGYMGNDMEIARSARSCMCIDNDPDRTDIDEIRLIRYLVRKRHTTPLEMCEVKFACRMPIFVARQWIRHRTANVNEMSLRYQEPIDEFYQPDPKIIAGQAKSIKQGRNADALPEDKAARIIEIMERHGEASMAAYHEMADELGLARELARVVLPVSLYTQWVWKIDLHNLMHFLELRLDPHAQHEIRVYAQAMADFVAAWVPWAWGAFKDYRLDAVTFTGPEVEALGQALGEILNPRIGLGDDFDGRPILRQNAMEALKTGSSTKAELDEFQAKLARLRA